MRRGATPLGIEAWMSTHTPSNRWMSAAISPLLAPSAAVRAILRHLDEDLVAGPERLFDPLLLVPIAVGGDVPGVEHTVLGLAEVDECRLHPRKHVAHLAEVDVVGERRPVGHRDVVLDEERTLEHHDLGLMGGTANEHLLAFSARRRGNVLGNRPGRSATPRHPRRAPGALDAAPLPRLRLRRLGHDLGDAPYLDGATADASCLSLLDCISDPAPDHLRAVLAKQPPGEIPSAPAPAGGPRS